MQTQQSTSECTPWGPAQFALPYMIEYDINSVMRSQCHGHLKGVERQLADTTKQAGSTSSVAAGSLILVLGPTSYQPATISELVHQKVQGLMTSYHQYI